MEVDGAMTNPTTPSYEDLMPRGRRVANSYADKVKAMQPGEVIIVEVPEGRDLLHVRQSILRAGRLAEISIFTRHRDGVLYVIRHKDEDIPSA